MLFSDRNCIFFPYHNKEPYKTGFLSPQKIFLKNSWKRFAISKESCNFAAELIGLQDDIAKNLLSEA